MAFYKTVPMRNGRNSYAMVQIPVTNPKHRQMSSEQDAGVDGAIGREG